MSVYLIFTESHWSSFKCSDSNIRVRVSVGIQRTKMPAGKKLTVDKSVVFMKESVEYSVCLGPANNVGVEVSSG